MEEKLIIIKKLSELPPLVKVIEEAEYIAFDTETTGVDNNALIIGFSVAVDETTGYYVVLSYWDKNQKKLIDLETKTAAKDVIFGLVGKKLIMQNAPFDCRMVENNYKIDLMPSVFHDTLICGHLLNENRHNGLKERGVELFGEDARKEQAEMKESVTNNGGLLTKTHYELYKADADLIAKYGAKDAILTIKVFYNDVPELYAQGLDKFFYEDESMPLLKGPTYDLNSAGLRIDSDKLDCLRRELESECEEAKSFIYRETHPLVKHEYPGTAKNNTFNINSSKQLSWLLFHVLENDFNLLTKEGRELCKFFQLKLPYALSDKRAFIRTCKEYEGKVWHQGGYNPKTKRMARPKTVGNYWNYLACGKESLQKFSNKYKWAKRLLEYKKAEKLLNTYVIGIQERAQYNIIRPSFLQHGTTSGRYSSKNPNFQNLPRSDKRVKACIVSRPGKIFVGADYSQLEPRVFASFSKDERLLKCFKDGDDFYSVIGVEIFEKYDCSLKKDDPNSFAKLYPDLRDISKVVALSSTYGTTAPKMAPTIKKSMDEAQEIINSYFEKFPSVHELMLESHEMAMNAGYVLNHFGRPRRMPKAMDIRKIYGKKSHSELPYEARNILNLAMNHRIQSTGASIMNRAAIACWKRIRELETLNPLWTYVKIVLQVHDELILEGPEDFKNDMIALLKDCMENTVHLPGVDLIAEPKAAYNLADLK